MADQPCFQFTLSVRVVDAVKLAAAVEALNGAGTFCIGEISEMREVWEQPEGDLRLFYEAHHFSPTDDVLATAGLEVFEAGWQEV